MTPNSSDSTQPLPGVPVWTPTPLSFFPTSSPPPTTTTTSSYNEVVVTTELNPRLPNGIVVVVLMVLGLVGNGLVLYVYQFKMPRTVFANFVSVLALLDLCTTLISMPFDVVIKFVMVDKTYAWDSICKVAHFEVYSTSLASGSVLLLIAVTRYIKVCRPMQPGLTKRHARLLCFVVILVAMLLCTVTFIINGMEKVKLAVGERVVVLPPVNGTVTPSLSLDSVTTTNSVLSNFDSSWLGSQMEQNISGSSGITSLVDPNTSSITPLMEQNISESLATTSFVQENTTKRSTMIPSINGSESLGMSSFLKNSSLNSDSASVTESPRNGSLLTEVVEVYICRTNENHKGTALYYALQAVLMTAFVVIFICLIILHWRISRAVTQFERRQSSMRRISVYSTGEQQNLTHITASMFRIFATITVIFVVSYLPHLICLIVEKSLFLPGETMPIATRVVMDLAYNFPYINVVTNPFIYGYRSQEFRGHCLQLICRICRCCWCRRCET